jgi:dihydroflavonol-4-reductase
VKVPRAVTLFAAGLSEVGEGHLLRRHPSVPLEAARMSTSRMALDDTRAREELGYSSRPPAEALAYSARWFVGSDRVDERRVARIRWSAA